MELGTSMVSAQNIREEGAVVGITHLSHVFIASRQKREKKAGNTISFTEHAKPSTLLIPPK